MVPFGEIEVGADPAQSGRALGRVAIVRLATLIGSDASDRQACLEAITETAAELLHANRVGIWLYDAARVRIACADLFESGKATHSRGLALAAADYPVYFQSLEEERIIAAHDAKTDPRTAEFADSYLRPLGIGAMLDAPIRAAGRMVGVICHEFIGGAREWTPEEQALAASMGDFVSLTLESSERVRAQNERAEMADRLARARKMEALGRLAGSIAHDFNNLLTAIHGSVELVRHAQERDKLDDQTLGEELGHIEYAADRAGRLVKQLLGFSRHEVVDPQDMDAAGTLNGMRELLVRLLGDTVRLDLKTEPGTPWIKFDKDQFEHLVLNLASNARDAMPHGGDLRIRLLGTGGAARHKWMEMRVTDTGEGIPHEVLPLIFEPFYSTKTMGTGWGLGLATVQRLIESAGGHIFVRSEPGKGTVFRIRLPAIHAEAAATTTPAPVKARATVLICEDESRIRAPLEQTLSDAGYIVHGARDAAQARKIVRGLDGPLDLLLSDVILPGASGPVLAKEFSCAHPKLRVLYVSGYSKEELQRNGVSIEASGLIQKPFKAADVLLRVRDVLR